MTIYQNKLKELEDRTTTFSVNIVEQLGELSENKKLGPLIVQLIRSSSSIGANYAEANNASSKTDFKNKIYIAKKEAAETKYWLTVLDKLIDKDLSHLKQEAVELNLIFQKIISTMKDKSKSGK